jgi:hypothetical protein
MERAAAQGLGSESESLGLRVSKRKKNASHRAKNLQIALETTAVNKPVTIGHDFNCTRNLARLPRLRQSELIATTTLCSGISTAVELRSPT